METSSAWSATPLRLVIDAVGAEMPPSRAAKSRGRLLVALLGSRAALLLVLGSLAVGLYETLRSYEHVELQVAVANLLSFCTR